LRDSLDRALAIRRGIADVLFARPLYVREALSQHAHDIGGIVDRQRCLGDKGQRLVGPKRERRHRLHRLDQLDRPIGKLSHRAHDLRVPFVADQDDLPPRRMVVLGLVMDLADQRAGGVQIHHVAALRFQRHALRHAMRREHHRPVGRRLVQFLDEDGAHGLERGYDMAIVYDLMAYIDRPAVLLERHFDDLDCAVHAGAKAARGSKQNFQRWGHGVAVPPVVPGRPPPPPAPFAGSRFAGLVQAPAHH
jgi:hypothetical protein